MVNYNNVGVTQLAGTPTAGQVIEATSGSVSKWGNNLDPVQVSGTPTTGQVVTATSGAAANWQTPVIAASAPITGLGAITGTVVTDIGPTYTVLPVGAVTGSAYKLSATVNLTAVGTASSDNIIIAAYYGGVAGTQLVNLNPLNAAGSIVGAVGFIRIEADVVFVSATSTLTVIRATTLASSGNGSAVVGRSGNFTQTGLTSGGNLVLTLGWQFQQNTGAPSVTPIFADILRVA